jgi:hypothetical protein
MCDSETLSVNESIENKKPPPKEMLADVKQIRKAVKTLRTKALSMI